MEEVVSYEPDSDDEQVDGFDSDERDDHAAQTVDEQVALEDRQRADGLVHSVTDGQAAI